MVDNLLIFPEEHPQCIPEKILNVVLCGVKDPMNRIAKRHHHQPIDQPCSESECLGNQIRGMTAVYPVNKYIVINIEYIVIPTFITGNALSYNTVCWTSSSKS